MSKVSIIKRIVLEITSNGIIILYNNELSSYQLSSVENYKVINRKSFTNDIETILEKNNISPLRDKINISIIIDKTYTDLDRKNFLTIFKFLKFNKIEFLDITNILDLSDNEVALDIAENNIKIYHKQNVYSTNIYFSFIQEILYLYLNKLVKLYNINTIKVFGNYKDIPIICNYLEKKLHVKFLIYSYSAYMPIKLFT